MSHKYQLTKKKYIERKKIRKLKVKDLYVHKTRFIYKKHRIHQTKNCQSNKLQGFLHEIYDMYRF